ncbi:Trimeric GatFAB AmidoTransferase(AdT) complex subunit [Ceratobasidium sp. 370]|nr:Trimeric GatFAB AmidoTransferase(AdT) complex subunit [Ceratobasidium sp. 370]
MIWRIDVISHYDVRDPTSAPEDLRKSAHAASQARLDSFNSNTGGLSGIKIGIPQEYFPEELDQAAQDPFRVLVLSLARHGARIVQVSLPSTPYALSAYYVLASAEANSNLSRYDGIRYGSRMDVPEGTDLKYAGNAYAATRSAGFGDEVKKRILLGAYALSADAFENYFLQAQRVRALVRDDFNKVFGNRAPNLLQSSVPASSDEGIDVLLHPSAIRTAPPLSSTSESSIDAYVQDVLTVPASLAGLPALSIPYGKGVDGWPLGASVVGQWGYDAVVCYVGQAIEACVKATEIE